MSQDLRHVYAEKAISQIPRILTLEDRNAFSPTYGCFKRTYWLDKVDDFPDALPQFGVLSLALVYGHDMPSDGALTCAEAPAGGQGKPGNIYRGQPKILEWILAGMQYWTRLQHRDGSFDEFYPNEHGWTGPTGFLLYGMLRSYLLLEGRGDFPNTFKDQFLTTCRKAADYIIQHDEHGVLANHHAMAVLPVAFAAHVLGDRALYDGYERKLADFLATCHSEGWSLEYDGADIGYLSATVSFLGKTWKLNRDERLLPVMEKAVEFLSYFVYPNGFFAGSMGSRNTLHFYPHGCELLAAHNPLAARVADAMLLALSQGKLVPAEVMADRYFLYRVPEHLESYVDFGERQKGAEGQERQGGHILPYERHDFQKVFPIGRFFVEKRNTIYCVGNAAKGGVFKVFRTDTGAQLLSDCGVIGRTVDRHVLTSQWIDPCYTFTPKEHGFAVSGALHKVPANATFTPLTLILFRTVLLLFGWHTRLAYWIKGMVRRLLMLRSGRVGAFFYRGVEFQGDTLVIRDVLRAPHVKFQSLQLGDEFFVRYVPQSRYFQAQELSAHGYPLARDQIMQLNTHGSIELERVLDLRTGACTDPRTVPSLPGTMGIDYSEGRKYALALTYRLRRRAEELIAGIRRYMQTGAKDLLDVGSAEGKVLSHIQDAFPDVRCTGLEYAQELIDSCTDARLRMIQGDAMHPPFPDRSFDVVTASALIEHVSDPQTFLREIHRVLRPGGIILVTTPDPLFEKVATAIGHLPPEDHQETMTLAILGAYLRGAGFEVLELQKFMLSPWGCPGEAAIERIIKSLGIQVLLLNQLAIGRRK